MADDLVTIGNGTLTARINPLGAELWSLTDAKRREYMTDADPRWWTGHAPLLFPIVGALRDGRYRLEDREYALPKHGFARTTRFEAIETREERARFCLRDNDETRAAYPFAFTLDMAFAVEGATLAMTATVTNPGTEALPFSFGFHPAFAWPLPGGGDKAAHRIVFDRNENAPVRRIDTAGLLKPQAKPTTVIGRTLAPTAELFEADALIWDDLASRALRFEGENGAALDIAFPDTPHLGIWQKPGAPFLAIEPWQGMADPADFTGDFRDKPGVLTLPPGAAKTFRMDVTVRPA